MSTTQPIRDHDMLQQFKQYYQTIQPNKRNYTLCIFALNTALRITDVLHLSWGDVWDYEKDSVKSHLMITEKKTNKESQIALNTSVQKVLKDFFNSYSFVPAKNEYLFPGKKGHSEPLSRSQAFRIVKQAAAEIGLPEHVSCHSLRKTFGYHAWKQGVQPAVIMHIYNHSSFQITKRYLGIDQDDKDKVFFDISL